MRFKRLWAKYRGRLNRSFRDQVMVEWYVNRRGNRVITRVEVGKDLWAPDPSAPPREPKMR